MSIIWEPCAAGARVLRVLGELSFREIGALFHKTESWARVTFHRARLKIKEAL